MSLLEDLYNGKYCPPSDTKIDDPAYLLAQEEIEHAAKELIREHRELYPRDLNRLRDSYSSLLVYNAQSSFLDGVRFCARFLAEAFLEP